MKNKVIFMTGATSGLGKVAALHAANSGATLIVFARNKEKGKELVNFYASNYPNGLGKIEILVGDLSSFASVVSACNEFKTKYDSIDMIINNAGIMSFKPNLSKDGIEETFQVNLLSPLLICHLLFDLLLKSTEPKIIFTASGLHQGEIMFNNLEFKNNFSSYRTYRQSKLGVILCCRLLSGRLKEYNIEIYSQHPGMVRTELGRSAGWISKLIFLLMGVSTKKGAKTLIYLMDSTKNSLISGEYYADEQIKKTTPQSYDMEVAQKLNKTVQKYLKNYLEKPSPIFPTSVGL
ncbi:MAG: SDR family NAD(P)-dependent oxidoreductase [Paludibacter sp.]|nr:SDR family NAD(P)-dependent oxidoreductase [Paludibacter sp.]